jgi:tripartite ATP-independent transporter DctP family solute receptor
MKKWYAVFLSVIVAVSITACGSGSSSASAASGGSADAKFPKREMRIGIGVTDTHFQYKGLQQMEEYIEKESQGSINVEIFHSGQLGSNEQVLEAIKASGAEMGTCDTSVLGNFVPEFNLLSIPFLFATQEEADAIAQGSEWSKKLMAKLEPAGYKAFGIADFGFRHMTNNVRPITKIADFKGLKIRTMQTPIHLDVFRALGANPTPMASNEVFSALQQGVVDGQENPLMNIYNFKFHEVQKYLTLTGHVYSFIVLTSGTKWFNSLSPEQQTIVLDGAGKAMDYIREAVRKEDELAYKLLTDYGLKINELSPSVLKEMQEIAKPVAQKFAETINPEFYTELMNAIAALR